MKIEGNRQYILFIPRFKDEIVKRQLAAVARTYAASVTMVYIDGLTSVHLVEVSP